MCIYIHRNNIHARTNTQHTGASAAVGRGRAEDGGNAPITPPLFSVMYAPREPQVPGEGRKRDSGLQRHGGCRGDAKIPVRVHMRARRCKVTVWQAAGGGSGEWGGAGGPETHGTRPQCEQWRQEEKVHTLRPSLQKLLFHIEVLETYYHWAYLQSLIFVAPILRAEIRLLTPAEIRLLTPQVGEGAFRLSRGHWRS